MQVLWPYRALESLTFQKFSSVDTVHKQGWEKGEVWCSFSKMGDRSYLMACLKYE